jgi:hypothetical protein
MPCRAVRGAGPPRMPCPQGPQRVNDLFDSVAGFFILVSISDDTRGCISALIRPSIWASGGSLSHIVSFRLSVYISMWEAGRSPARLAEPEIAVPA